jgi:hypothetical protein
MDGHGDYTGTMEITPIVDHTDHEMDPLAGGIDDDYDCNNGICNR